MKVHLIARTAFTEPCDVGWEANDEDRDGDALVEFAGRACYQSWNRPNPATATNYGYLKNILESGHFSVLEHASATFYVEGVSRSLTHELVRHRHLSFSQLSQRFIDESDAEFITPPALAGDESALVRDTLALVKNTTQNAYDTLVAELRMRGCNRKQAREAARCVLPNMTETKIVVSGNYRAWRHFVSMRATAAADVEIRTLAIEILLRLKAFAPNSFGDFQVVQLPDGTFAASTPNHEA